MSTKSTKKAPAKKPHLKVSSVPKVPQKTSATISAIEALELRVLEYQVTTAQAALNSIAAMRNLRAEQIVKAAGIDMTVGKWHIDADKALISLVQE